MHKPGRMGDEPDEPVETNAKIPGILEGNHSSDKQMHVGLKLVR